MAIMVIVIQIGAIYVPFMQKILRTQSLAMADLTVCLIFGTLVFLAIETEKLIVRSRLPVREN
jgi:hypothetical protein